MERLGFLYLLLSGGLFLSAAEPAASPEPVQNEKIPVGMREIPFVDSHPEPAFIGVEKKRGFMLFSRPLTAPVYPAGKPFAHERIASLRTFGARGQYVNLNFCVYPLRDLPTLQVRDSGGPGKRELRHVAYWKVRFPFHNSGNYRRTPEYLFPHGAPLAGVPKAEPQRFLLTVRIPDDAPAGTMKGVLTVAAAGQEAKLPYEIEVLPFTLKRDPAKHFSAYNYTVRSSGVVNRKYAGNDAAWRRKASINQYRRMVEYGFTMPPFLYFTWAPRKGEFYEVDHLDEILDEMKAAGMKVPFIIIGGCCENWLYQRFTGKKLGGHSYCEVPPPEAMYRKIDSMLKVFLKEAKAKNYPPMVFAPVDEPGEQSMPHVCRIYEIFKRNGCVTYMTQCTFEAQARGLVDYWCDQAFRSLAEVLKADKKAYFCYPNFNSYEIKDAAVMTRGGRMAYGFGLWKSNYNYMIPWIWNSGNLHLERRSGGGNFITEEGKTEVSMPWECFREGIIDGMYIYTLSDAIIRREPAKNPELAALLKEGRTLLQKDWDDIPPLAVYQASGHFSDGEFDGKRAEIAALLKKILKYPETNRKVAPSIIIDPFRNMAGSTRVVPPDGNRVRWAGYEYTAATDSTALYAKEREKGNLEIRDLPRREWGACEREAKLEMPDKGVIRFHIQVDHKNDGTGLAGERKYLLGWPRLTTWFGGAPVDFNDYDFLVFRLKVTSNRTGKDATWWPVGLTLRSGKNSGSLTLLKRIEPEGWKDYVYPVNELRDNFHLTPAEIGKITEMNFSVSESRYHHGDDLKWDFGGIALVRVKKPVILSLEAAPEIECSQGVLPWRLTVLGGRSGGLTVEQLLSDPSGKIVHRESAPLETGEVRGAAPLDKVKFSGDGRATGLDLMLTVNVKNKDGGVLASARKPVRVVRID